MNDDNNLETIPREIPLEERKLIAFKLWADTYSRNTKRVADHLNVDRRTIQKWVNDGEWEHRRIDDLATILPGMSLETAIPLKLAGYKAAKLINALVDEAENNRTPLDLKQIQALALIVDRAGYSPVGARDPVSGVANLRATPKLRQLDQYSDDELAQHERDLAHGRQRDTDNRGHLRSG